MKLAPVLVLAVAGISCALQAQVQMHGHVGPAFPPVSAALPKVHPERPATGLGAHDFLYAGESHDRRIFIVRKGKIAWSYEDAADKGEISDAVMLSNGNILFTHQFGITEITPDKQIIWTYTAPAGTEVHTAVPIGKDHILYIQNGDIAVLRVVNTTTNQTEKEITLKTSQPPSTHGQFRHARLTPQGTVLVAHMDLNKVVEYDSDGNEVWSFPANRPWSATPLKNGNVLITDNDGVREVTHRGDIAWSFSPADLPAYKFDHLQLAWRLPNGNTVVNNWVDEWHPTPADTAAPQQAPLQAPLQAMELTPDKHPVWVLASWTAPENLGPATTIQFLDEPVAPEDVHFGDIK